ncbi:hypothetical protein pdam_00006362 [Pocillopora damicornis]|uniref:Uncharacterized protein n=1 Tax=Pocillopora damicornis TaxID=46731 RepID=A0A3M6TQN9_POCDA|nr:hypothetical protein pdam_00006362 [Pocillopora damicornis]
MMVKRELRRDPPSLYYKGETVLIRVPVSKKLSKTRWFKGDDITSVTKEEENDRQQKAKSNSGRRNDTCTGHEADSPGQPAKRARTDNASLLEASIDQISSSESLMVTLEGTGDLQVPTFTFIASIGRNIYILKKYRQQRSVGV